MGALVGAALTASGCVCSELPDDDECQGFGCGDRTPEPDPGDDDDDDDDDSAWVPDDDDAVDDDDVVPEDSPCEGMDWSPVSPPTIAFGGTVGDLEFERAASCEPSGNLRQLFAGWIDGSPFSLSFLVTLTDTEYPTVADFAGHTLHAADMPEPLVLHLDVGDAPYHFEAPEDMASVQLFEFEEGVSFAACVYDHGGVWRHTASNEVIRVPDPLLFVCDP